MTVLVSEERIEEIIAEITAEYRTFGGGQDSQWNPLAAALKDDPPQFAAGVDVEDVVRSVIEKCDITHSKSGAEFEGPENES